MIVLIGSFIVIASVLGGFMMAGGNVGALIHVSEFVIIGGAALGALVIMSPKKVLIDLIKQCIGALKGFVVDASKPFFHEFVVKCPRPVGEINARLIEKGIIGGYDLGQDYPHLKDHMLICVTEMNTRDEIDALVDYCIEHSSKASDCAPTPGSDAP